MTTYAFTNLATNETQTLSADELARVMCYEHEDILLSALAREVGVQDQLERVIEYYDTALNQYEMAIDFNEHEIAGNRRIWHTMYGNITPDLKEASDDYFDARMALCEQLVAIGGQVVQHAYALCNGIDADKLTMSVSQ